MINRIDVKFSSDGTTCRAWLYLPESDEKRPVVVMGHGLGAIREMRLDAYAELFCAVSYPKTTTEY